MKRAGAISLFAMLCAGAAVCWGLNDRGQLGRGTTSAEELTRMLPDADVVFGAITPPMLKIAKNLENTGKAPAIYNSNGEGSYTSKKHYFADNVHLVTLNSANAQTAKDANGTFNGCPAPVNCSWCPSIVWWMPSAACRTFSNPASCQSALNSCAMIF